MITEITGEELKEARIRMGKTQEQLAEEIEISTRQLSRFENNMNLDRYCRFLALLKTLDLLH